MSTGLSVYVRRFLLHDLASATELRHPVLIWERRSGHRDVHDEFSHLTEIITDFEGALVDKTIEGPSPGREVDEPLVFVLHKSEAPEDPPLEVTLGRTEQNDLVVQDSSVSRLHASFRQDASSKGWSLIDRGSSNGTWVGSTRLVPNLPEPIPDRSRLRFGSVELLFLTPLSFLEYLRAIVPATPRKDELSDPAEAFLSPHSPPRPPSTTDSGRRRFEFSLTLRDVDELLEFYRQSMKVFEVYGAKVGKGDPLLELAHERAAGANEILRRLLVAAKLNDL